MERHDQLGSLPSLQATEDLRQFTSHDADGIPERAIREELTKVLQHTVFVNSDRLSRFLRFTVEAVLTGNADTLKEYVIGVEVYDRKPPYHPTQDSIVRTEARRLRNKLKGYYETDGRNDPVFIYFRPGSYAPVFRAGKTTADSSVAEGESEARLPMHLGVAVAVLPFADASANALTTACAKGLTDELIHAFMKTDRYRVIDERSGAQAASQHLTTPALARSLGVQIVVGGTVRIEGNRLRITAQLVNADGFQIWSQRFEVQFDPQKLFAILESIASALVSRVRSSHTGIRQSPISMDSFNSAVHRNLLMVETLLDERTPDGLEEALTRCKSIIQAAPRCARAHADIGRCYCAIATSGAPDSAEAVLHGKESARYAVELEPEMIAAQSCLATLSALEWNWNEAETRFRYALSLGPYALTERQFAIFLCAQQRFDEAWPYLQRSEQGDPFSHRQRIVYSQFLYFSREFEEVEQHFAETSAYGPQPLESRLYLALSRVKLGHIDLASRSAHSLRREASTQPAAMSRIAEILALCGEKDTATRLANDWRLFSPQSPVSRFRQARLLLALDHGEAALSTLSTAAKEREADLVWLIADPGFDAVRETAVFRHLLSRVTSQEIERSQAAG